tara:strand:+ start:10776 stop:11903 length:1128 start_codon:yes stop_codon:yes gene_type:complete
MNKALFGILLCLFFKAEGQTPSALADSLYAAGNYQEAMAVYKTLPNSLKQQATIYEHWGQLSQAIALYEKELKTKPKDARIQFSLAKLFFRNGTTKQADSLLQQLIATHPDQATYYYQRGLVLENTNDSLAQTLFTRTLQLEPNHQNARYQSARYALTKREFETAHQYISEALEQQPNSLRFLTLRALHAFYTEDFHQAIQDYEVLLEVGKSNESIHEHVAIAYRNTLQFEKALEQYKILINQFNDKVPEWHSGVAATYSGLKEYDKAERHYEIAILLKRPAVDDEYMQLALLYGAQKQYGKQYKALQRVVAENPESQRGWYMLATAVENQQADASKAIPHYEKYLEKFGENALYSEYAKQRIKDITTQLHFEKD